MKANLLSPQSLGMKLCREEVPKLEHQGSMSCHQAESILTCNRNSNI